MTPATRRVESMKRSDFPLRKLSSLAALLLLLAVVPPAGAQEHYKDLD
jgi:hypothetical protein